MPQIKNIRLMIFVSILCTTNYVFPKIVWQQVGKIIKEEAYSKAGSSIAVTTDGNFLAVGEPGFNSNTGRVKIFQYDNKTNRWLSFVTAIIEGENSGDSVGSSVAITYGLNGTLFIAEGEPGWSAKQGRVRIFQYDINNHSLSSVGEIDGQNSGDQAGSSVAITYDTNGTLYIAEGEPGWNTSGYGSSQGRVKVYQYTNNIFSQMYEFQGASSDAAAGTSVSIVYNSSGLIVAIGQPGYNSSQGITQTYIFENNWTQYGQNLSGEFNSQSGTVLQLSGNGTNIIIGEPGEANGNVKLYEYSQGQWILDQNNSLLNTSNIGNVVAISDDGEYIGLQQQNPSSLVNIIKKVSNSSLAVDLSIKFRFDKSFELTSLALTSVSPFGSDNPTIYFGVAYFNRIAAFELKNIPAVWSLQNHPVEVTHHTKPINPSNLQPSPDAIPMPTIPTKELTTPSEKSNNTITIS